MGKKREEQQLPSHIKQALVYKAGGMNWKQSAEAVGVAYETLLKWMKHPDAQPYLDECDNQMLAKATSTIADAAPLLANRLIELSLSKDVKPYAQIQAITASFNILQQNIINKENRDQIKRIRDSLDALEGNSIVDI